MKKYFVFIVCLSLSLSTYAQGFEKAFTAQAYQNETRFHQGVALIEQGKYLDGVAMLESANYDRLGRYVQDKFRYYHGYGKLMLDDYTFAAADFESLTHNDNEYRDRATYYYGYCLYHSGQYDRAIPVLVPYSNRKEYYTTVPYYILQMRYALGEKDEVLRQGQELLSAQPTNANNPELHRILGEICFDSEDYTGAIEHLQYYIADNADPIRLDQYLFGHALYMDKNYSYAIDVLKSVPQQKDSISEAAYLTLGLAELHLDHIAKAKLCFLAARDMNITPEVHEEAAYNYVICAYETSTALGEGLNAINAFLDEFPQSRHHEQVYALQGEALLKAKNYAAALKALEQVSQPDSRQLEICQYLRYQLGTDAYAQGDWQSAEDWMTVIIRMGQAPDFVTEAYYWRAEARYQQEKYADAEEDLHTFLSRDRNMQTANYRSAQYLLGYSHFAQQEYDDALHAFLPILNQKAADDIYTDSQCRVGDCYFNARQFEKAILHYTAVSNTNTRQADYALYHIGYAQGLQRKYKEKAESMKALVKRFPESKYADKALYERARAFLALKDNNGALQAYQDILSHYPKSTLAPRSSVECGILYHNMHLDEKAIDAFKHTVATYPDTDEAYTALESLEQLYVALNRTDEYVAYTKQLENTSMQIEVNADSLALVSAEIQFQQGNRDEDICRKVLETYDIRTSMGAEAHYTLAQLAYTRGDTDQAEVLVNQFIESDSQQQYWLAKNLILLADIQARKGDYFLAQQYLLMLEQNYTGDSVILSDIRERLSQISENL